MISEFSWWLAGPVLALPLAIVFTKIIRERAVARRLFDHPNERSSHTVPTPRGGGLSIVVISLVFGALTGALGLIPERVAASLVGGGILVALVGFLDDLRPLTARPRLLAHFAGAAWIVVAIDGLPDIRFGSSTIDAGLLGGVLAVIGIVWCINLFNFMDGIDGIASVETVFVAGWGGVLLWMSEAAGLSLVSIVLAAASAGFLVWNWAPAKIFMGDVASGFIGLMIGALAVASERSGAVPILVWAILGSAFIVDATVTFVRLLPHKGWSEAHRLHAYQRAVQSGWSHAQVSTAVAALNVVLGTMATAAFFYPSIAPALTALAFTLVAAVYTVVERLRPLKLEERSF